MKFNLPLFSLKNPTLQKADALSAAANRFEGIKPAPIGIGYISFIGGSLKINRNIKRYLKSDYN